MLRFVGSNYQYCGEILSTPECIFIEDHHYNEETKSFPVKNLLENSTCDPKKHTLIFDHVLQHDDILKEYTLVCLPLFLARSAEQFNRQHIQVNWTAKTSTFNFMINKVRLHRAFLLMLVEHFNLTNYEYTLCWKNNHVNRKQMIKDNSYYQSIINTAKLTIPPRQYLFGHERLLDQGLQYGHKTNAENYQAFLQTNVFEPSCISLITEPAFYERETIITEKTIMSIYGGTIPIWVGGWRIADWMRSSGFDVFDDIVDHSYQNLEDPYERCYEAISRNIDLLKDFETVKSFISNNQHRLEKNLNLLKQNKFFTDCIDKQQSLGIKLL